MKKADIVIIGAGIVGLAIATAVSKKGRTVIVVEKENSFGQGASSRNSEIIHSGIYYRQGSLKADLCIKGKNLIYSFCREQNIPFRKTGKLIVATDDSESEEIDGLFENGKANGVGDLRLLDKKEIKKIEPEVSGDSAIYSPSTGIVDTHQLMKRLQYLAENKGAVFAYGCEVRAIDKKPGLYNILVRDTDGEDLTLTTPIAINSAGIYSDTIASMAGIDIDKSGYRIHYSKGEYFKVTNKKAKLLNSLIYPAPKSTSLGIHTVIDLQGEVKLGPSARYADSIDYNVDPTHRDEFYESTKTFLPFLNKEDLAPDTAGIRAKIQREGEPEKDFVIKEESDKGLPGMINLIGIESPGFTSSLAIAKYVENML